VGYKPKRTLYKLHFENPDLEGLEVVTRSVSMEGLVKLLGLAEGFEAADERQLTAEDMAKVEELLRLFARMLVEWNVEDDDDQPVPANYEGLASQDFAFVLEIITAAGAGLMQAPPPLPGSSGNGQPPTGPESLDLASSSTALPSSPSPT